MDISLATFISGKETFSDDFNELQEYLKKYHNVQAYVFTDEYIDEIPNSIIQINMPHTSKYLRIMRIVEESLNDSILFIDNDIIVDKDAVNRFLSEYREGEYALAWGRIGTTINTGFVPALIEIDKILSHNIIRPCLWKLGVGISLPGQIFVLNKKYFLGCMQARDTVYDDLALGVVLKKNHFPFFQSKEYLGTEMPKQNIHELIRQRKRWAQGYSETLYNNRKDSILRYILIHGFAYHFLWIPVWFGIIYMLVNRLLLSAMVLVLLISSVLSWGKAKRFLVAFQYIFVFPFVHLNWLLAFLKNLYCSFINET